MMPIGERINGRLVEEGGSPYPPEVLGGLERFAEEVERWSRRTHLVGKSRMEENIFVSMLDSLHLLQYAGRSGDLGRDGSRAATVGDIGAGAGFPGIVWAIACPGMEITLFERSEKPRLFLERTARLLGLGGSVAVEGEAAVSGRARRFDLVVSKAAGRWGTIAPIVEALMREGGIYLTIKGDGWEAEMADAREGSLEPASWQRLPGSRGSMLRMRRKPAG